MAEQYPSDNDLLALTSDADTGVEYIATGTVPYYLAFRKLLHRLLLSVKRGNDLRVYKAGLLEIGVKPGKFWVNGTLVTYAGTVADVTLADNKPNIYVYLNSAGVLVTDEYAAFPDMSASPHVRLAIITTLGGKITALVDARDHHSISVPGGSADLTTVTNVTSDRTLLQSESGQVFSNRGATGTITITLPANAAAGTKFTFAVQEFQRLQVDPGAGTIRDDIGQTADKYKWADSIGECITLVADANGDWATIAKFGTWGEEA